MTATAPRDLDLDHVRWHDLECGGYGADRALWLALAAERADAAPGGGRILDLGCGTGRIALELATAGHAVLGADVDPVLVAELRRRAALRGVPAAGVVADAERLDLGERFGLVVVPMQTVQLLDGAAGRARMLAALPGHLAPGAVAAIAIVEDVEPFGRDDAVGLAPDMRDHDGTVYASLPVGVTVEDGLITLDRVREIVEPSGDRHESSDRTRLHVLDADRLEAEARAAGLLVLPRRTVAATAEHVGSRVVVLGA